MQNKDIQVEAERGELLVRNSHGDIAIIPRDKASKVRELLSSGCNDCIDNVVSSLPTLKHYAQDGTVIPNDRKILLYTGKDSRYDVKTMAPRKGVRQNDDGSNSTHLMSYTSAGNKYYAYPTLFQNGDKWVQLDDKNDFAAFKEAQKRKEVFEFNTEKEAADFAKGSWKNQYKEYDINSPEYEELYNSGHLASYDKNTDTYIATPLKEVTVTAEAPQWLKDKRKFEKSYTKQQFTKEYLPKWAASVGETYDNLSVNSQKKYDKIINDKVVENIFKRKPTFDTDYSKDRLKTLQGFSQKELELIKNSSYSSKIEPSIWSKFEQGLLSVGNAGSPVTFKNENLTQKEAKKEDNPLNILQPLSVLSKMVQSVYKKDYSLKDALKGKQNNAGIVEDIVTDPLNLVGLGIWSKLSKANKFSKLEDAYQAIKTLDKTTLEKQIGTTLSNDDWQYLYRVQEKGFDIEKPTLKAIEERVASGKGKWYDNNILNNPELRANMESRDRYYGQWFEKDPKRLDYYLADKEDVEILRTKVPKEILEQYRIDKFDPEIAKKWSLSHETEYILPKDLIQKAEKFKRNDWQKLIDEHEIIKNKVLNKTDDVVKTAISSVDDVNKSVKPAWQTQELPGLHLKSTMEGEAISKIVEPKTGLVNVEQALAIIGKESGGADKVALIKQGLGNNIPKKMDYNEFRKVVQDQLIPLERQFSTQSSNYGVGRLGYPSPKRSSYEAAIKHNEEMIAHYKKQIAAGSNNSSLRGDLQNAINNLENSKKELATLPLENQTLILGNKSKFGRGSSAHGNPDETLGHIHFLRDAETPDVLTVTQIQSDAFQGTHRIMPKDSKNLTALEKQQKSLARMEELQERNKSILHKMKTEGLDEAGLPVQDYQIKQFEDIVKAQEQSNLFKKADIENFTQKQLLDKNHQERYLQELVDYAGKRGDVNKVRVPTSETAAKVQGYTKTYSNDLQKEITKLKEERLKTASKEGIYSDKFKNLDEQIKILELNNEKKYLPEHQTILKKYSEQPKTIKKLFGEEPKIVTDSKGNTWYEFDIPKKFKEGKGEIKAFQVIPPTIGSAVYLQSQKQNKTEQ